MFVLKIISILIFAVALLIHTKGTALSQGAQVLRRLLLSKRSFSGATGRRIGSFFFSGFALLFFLGLFLGEHFLECLFLLLSQLDVVFDDANLLDFDVGVLLLSLLFLLLLALF